MVMLSTQESVGGRLVAAVLFWGLGLAFGHIYLRARSENWWAIMPGGFMIVLGVVIGLSQWVQSLEVLGAVLFGGLGLVFLLLSLVGGALRHWWALVPGSILLLFGLFVLGGGHAGGSWRWWPLLAISAGVLIAWRALRPAPAQMMEINRAPAARNLEAGPVTKATPAAASTSIQMLDDIDDV